MTSPGSGSTEIVRLYSVATREELELELESEQSLRITKKIFHDGFPQPSTDTRHLNLQRDSVALLYTITDKVDLASKWVISITYGSEPSRCHNLWDGQDAFRFQRLLTGYTPYRRFPSVECRSLEQHPFNPFIQATPIDVAGEVQLWLPPNPQVTGRDRRDSDGTASGASAGGRPPSIQSFVPTQGRPRWQGGVAVEEAMMPPLLVCFAQREGEYQILRVDGKQPPAAYNAQF
jgi:hypothetical protein